MLAQVFESLAVSLEQEVGSAGADGAAPAPSPFGGEQGALVWAHYMRFLRRTGNVPGSRMVGGRRGVTEVVMGCRLCFGVGLLCRTFPGRHVPKV